MRYQFRNVPISVLLAVFLCCIFIASFLLAKVARDLIQSQQATVLPEQVVNIATLRCKVDIGGVFKYESFEENSDLGVLYAGFTLTNISDSIILPGGAFKFGLRWQGASPRTDQYRVELPNKIAPGEQLYFDTRILLHGWDNPNHILTIELMSEGAYWCSDYGGMQLALSRADNSGMISISPH